jgi:hypothetical protein
MPEDDRTRFDRERSRRAKEEGMGLAADSRHELLEAAREAMIRLALTRFNREADADDISSWLIDEGIHPSRLGPATPSVFRDGNWIWTGRWRKSARVSNHSSDLRIWKLV